MKEVLDYLVEHREMREEALEEFLNVKRTRACPVARQMMAKGLIEGSDRGVSQRYRMACERRAREVQKMAQNLKNSGYYGKINTKKGSKFFLVFPLCFPLRPRNKRKQHHTDRPETELEFLPKAGNSTE